MITSSVKTTGYFFSLLGFWGGLLFFFYMTNALITKEWVSPKLIEVGFAYAITSMMITMYGKLLWDSKRITIDSHLEQIVVTNRFTWFSKTYAFAYFTNSIIINQPIQYGTNRNLYLMKDKKACLRICDFIYSNHTELETELSAIKSLGEKKYSFLTSIKILFGQDIIE